jgi:L-lactate utilization protein LutC
MSEPQARSSVIDRVRRALGRTQPLSSAPVPPAIEEPITRLVHSEIGLPELFAKRAGENKMGVETVYVEDLPGKLAAFLGARGCRKVALPVSDFLEKLEIDRPLREAGFTVRRWGELSLDELYDFDAGITDVYCAVAETGSLVIRSSPSHGKALSLVPNVHVAIVQPKDFLPDLVDLFQKLTKEGVGSNVTLITGPSRTADIEMELVTGVHGPNTVQIYILQ